MTTPSFIHIGKWIKERYPAPVMVYASVLFLLCISVTLATHGLPVQMTSTQWVGAAMAISVFLMIRGIDEHKDYETDVIYHSHRVLQRGLITLNHIKIVVFLCALAQLAYSLYIDRGIGHATFAWGIMMAYLALMTKEFFVSEWLKKKLFLYSVSHMFIMVLIVYWFGQTALPTTTISLSVWPLMALTFLSGFSGEIIRKTWAPEEERDGVDSYAKIFGLSGACSMVLALLAGAAGILGYWIHAYADTHTSLLYMGIGFAYALPLFSIIRFMRQPSIKGRKLNELSVGLFMMLAYTEIILFLNLL